MVRISATSKLETDAPGSPRNTQADTFSIALSKVGRARWESTSGTKEGKPVTVFAQIEVSFRLL